MEFQEFIGRVINFFKGQLGNDYRVFTQEVKKGNGVALTALVIENPLSNISPCIYLDKYYEDFQNSREIFEAIAAKIMAIYQRTARNEMYDTSILTDYMRIKDKIRGKLINTEKNKELLSRVPHRKFLDLSVTYIALFGENEGGTQGSIQIDNAYMKRLGVTEQDLFDSMNANKEEMSLTDMMLLCNDFLKELDFLKLPKIPLSMYVLTNEKRIHAAIGMLDKKVMHKASEIFSGDFMILPSSIHELILIPNEEKREGTKRLVEMVQEINKTQVPEEEVLSGHIYRYNHQTGEIVIAA